MRGGSKYSESFAKMSAADHMEDTATCRETRQASWRGTSSLTFAASDQSPLQLQSATSPLVEYMHTRSIVLWNPGVSEHGSKPQCCS